MEGDKPILEDIAYMIVEGEGVEVEALFRERRILQGRMRQIDFLKSRVQLGKG
ncbi:MAG: CooT family nickel-binding protein [Dehalococcoidia bacterium]|nr:CooT family nickel-binding protein [Dehalococcoidia bacterium]